MHQRLTHASVARVLKACRDAGIKISDKEAREYHCKWCSLAKSTKIISHQRLAPAARPLAEITADTIEHKPTANGGYRYAVHLLDRYSNYQWIFFARSKDEIYHSFRDWITFIEKQTGLKIQLIHLDNGTEFVFRELNPFCQEHGLYLRAIVQARRSKTDLSSALD